MSNAYSIVEADIRKTLIDETTYDRLAVDPTTGTPLTSGEKQAIFDAAVLEFASWVTGTFAVAATLALAKPHALKFCVYACHFRRAANGDYEIPASVQADFESARDWAKGVGQKLLAAEGTVQVPGGSEVEYVAPDAAHDMEDLDRL